MCSIYRANKNIEDLPNSLMEEDIDSNSATEEMKSCIMPVINGLDEKYREAITLTELEGLSQKELASKLDISYTGAKSRVQRGRVLLKKMLQDCCQIEINQNNQLVSFEKKEKERKFC